MSIYSNNKLDNQTPNDAWFKIFSFVNEGLRVLDVGCSSGALGAELRRQKNAHVVGIDIDKDDVEKAKKNLDDAMVVNVEQDELSELGKFDVIIMADVIEHLVNPEKALKKLKKLLTDQGIIIFSIPNMANVTTRINLLEGKFEYKDFGLLDRTHLHFYDKQEVERVFMASGLQIMQTDCTIRNIPTDILEAELSRMGIKLTQKFEKLLNSEEAITYQFIGWARPEAKPKKFKIKTSSPLDSVSKQIDEINSAYRHETKLRDEELERRAEHIHQLDEKVLKLESEVETLKNSIMRRVARKSKKIAKKLSPKN